MHPPPDVETPMEQGLTIEEVKWLRERRTEWERARWLARLVMKVVMAVGAGAAALVTFKQQVLQLLGKG
jgi:hypothetical protein